MGIRHPKGEHSWAVCVAAPLVGVMGILSHFLTREEKELCWALHVTARVAEREAREELNMRLAPEETGQDYWWSQLPVGAATPL